MSTQVSGPQLTLPYVGGAVAATAVGGVGIGGMAYVSALRGKPGPNLKSIALFASMGAAGALGAYLVHTPNDKPIPGVTGVEAGVGAASALVTTSVLTKVMNPKAGWKQVAATGLIGAVMGAIATGSATAISNLVN